MTTPEEAVDQASEEAEETGVFSLRNLMLRQIPRPGIDLSRVTRLDLAGNRLATIPDWVWEATGVRQLEVSANRLAVIGEGISDLQALEFLDVSENRLNVLPSGLAVCRRLRELDAADNRIADVQVVEELARLDVLDLARNRLRSLEQLTGAAELKVLDLSANQIEDLPRSLAELHALRRLDLSGNLLTSQAIASASLPDNLVELFLDANRLDSFPERLAGRVRLSVLGNHFDVAREAAVPPVGAEVSKAVEELTTGAPEADRRYFDAPTYRLPAIELTDAADTRQVVDLYYKRFRDVGASIRFSTGTSVDLSQVGRRRALDYVAENAGTGDPTMIRLQAAGPEAKDKAASFIAEAAERAHRTHLITEDGTSVTFDGEAARRVLNVAVAEHAGSLLASHDALQPMTSYQLRVDIGPAAVDSLIVNAPEFPASQLTPDTTEGWWFDVVVASSWVDAPAESHQLFLPVEGPSWVCGCRGEHTCTPEQRKPYLFVPFTTRSSEGPVSIRCTVYQQNNAVQSVRVDAVVTTGGSTGAISGVVDYTLARDVAGSAEFAPRDLNVLVNEVGGVHTLVIKGLGQPIPVDLTETEAQAVLSKIREELSLITLGPDGQTNQYDSANAKPAAGLIKDLRALAHLGAALFNAVVPNLTDRLALADELARRATIQAARATRVAFPWALVYDIPHELAADFTLCPLLANWDGERSRLTSYPNACPHAAEHGINTLCPYGFWGFRHLIEQPASVRGERLITLIPVAPGSTAALIHSLQLDAAMTRSHLTAMQTRLQTAFQPQVCADRPSLLAAWNSPALPLIYFYCHGKTVTLAHAKLPVPVLEIGQDLLLGSGDFAAWAQAKLWTDPQSWVGVPPLVFINGCHTAALSPEDVVTFVDAFAGIHAAGVIGTEIAVAQATASEFADHFYSYFTGSSGAGYQPAGEALYRARVDLLAKGNVCGLVYTPFCSMDLVLQPSTASSINNPTGRTT
jgi:Leucine rich repeat/CHAT domain